MRGDSSGETSVSDNEPIDPTDPDQFVLRSSHSLRAGNLRRMYHNTPVLTIPLCPFSVHVPQSSFHPMDSPWNTDYNENSKV